MNLEEFANNFYYSLLPEERYHGTNTRWTTYDPAYGYTGEGAQRLGRGLYTTPNQGIAETYAREILRKGNTPAVVNTIIQPNDYFYLDKNLPLNKQTPAVREAVRRLDLGLPDDWWLSDDVYNRAVRKYQGAKEANKALREAGIAGMKNDWEYVTYSPEDSKVVKVNNTRIKNPKVIIKKNNQGLKEASKNIVKQGVKGVSKVIPVVGTIMTMSDIVSQLSQPVASGTLPINYRLQTGSDWERQQILNSLQGNYFKR